MTLLVPALGLWPDFHISFIPYPHLLRVKPQQCFKGSFARIKSNPLNSRRFRSAREAVEAEKKARDRGETLPTEERFDSNCITPGTEFMARLDAHLQYFVTYKISQDKMWQNCKVIYSGHEVKVLDIFLVFFLRRYHMF